MFEAPQPLRESKRVESRHPGEAEDHRASSIPGTPSTSREGRPIETSFRREMEERLGHDFGAVRVHADAQAEEEARRVGADAFTMGREISLRTADPDTAVGRRLLTHELVHVVQQESRGISHQHSLGSVGDVWESAAESFASGGAAQPVPTGAAPALQRQATRLDRGFGGEQQMGFSQYRFEDGWAVVRGPSGAGGHPINASGEDGLFYNVRNGVLRIADNKAFARARNVSSATAIDPQVRLLQNLDEMIAEVEAMGSSADITFRQDVLRLLRQTRAGLSNGTALPGRVQLVVHNELGRSTGVTARLRALGVRLIDGSVPVVPPEGTARPLLGLRSDGSATASVAASKPVTTTSPVGAGAAADEGAVSSTLTSTVSAEQAAAVSPKVAVAAEEAAAVGAGSRALTVAGQVGSALLRAAIFAVIVLGLDYLRRKAEAEKFRQRMQAEQPRMELALGTLSSQVTALQRSSGGATIWAHMTIWVRSQTSVTAGPYGFGGYDVGYDDAGFGGATVGLDYQASRSEALGKPSHFVHQAGVTTYTPSTETIVYSVPLPYDTATLSLGARLQRLAAIERDAARAGLPQPVLEALFLEREAFIGSPPH